jgi:hypothetical protein
VPADVLARAQELAVGREQARGVQRAGRAEQRLKLAQPAGQGAQDVGARLRRISV